MLFQDFAGTFAPLHNCYIASGKLISRKNTNDEVYSQYCPQCLTVYSSNSSGVAATTASVSAIKNSCPFCVLCPLCASTVNIAVTEDRKFYFQCSFCRYNTGGHVDVSSQECSDCTTLGLANPQPLLLGAHKDELFRKLNEIVTVTPSRRMAELIGSFSQRPATATVGDETRPIGGGYFDPVGLLGRESALFTAAAASVDKDFETEPRSALPTFVPLLCKYTVRTRPAEKEKTKTGSAAAGSILVQAKASPLDGDSSNKLQRGKWWGKDASAVHDVPGVCVRRIHVGTAEAEAQSAVIRVELEMDISNPKGTDQQMCVRRGFWESGDDSYKYSGADPQFHCAKHLAICRGTERSAAGWNRTARFSLEAQGQTEGQCAPVPDNTLQFDLASPTGSGTHIPGIQYVEVADCGLVDGSVPVFSSTLGGYVDELLMDEDADSTSFESVGPQFSGHTIWEGLRSHRNVITLRAIVEFPVVTNGTDAADTDEISVGMLDFSLQFTPVESTSPLRAAKEYHCRILIPLGTPAAGTPTSTAPS